MKKKNQVRKITAENLNESVLAIRSVINYLEIEASKNGFSYVILGLRFAQMMALQQTLSGPKVSPETLLEKFEKTYDDMQSLLLQEIALINMNNFFKTTH